ncbi:hypothetical protein QMN03_09825 [Leptospira santarosai]|uniref:hypothetical protein n=1 Tax=Leptospira santarosai TaxID=28183 RepID=UPI0024AEB5D4|nr:hypothetical protein [Leptospira santarosai]MDI7207193.1 hypothetical protein [Leptospira santarosai]
MKKKLVNKKHQFIRLESFDRNLKIEFGYSEDAKAEQIYSYENAEEAERSLQAYVLWKVWDLFREEDENEDRMMLRRTLLTAKTFKNKRIESKDLKTEKVYKAILEEDIGFFIANEDLSTMKRVVNNVNIDADTALILAVKNNKIAMADYLLHSMFIDSGKKNKQGQTAWDYVYAQKDPFLGDLFLSYALTLESDEQCSQWREELGIPQKPEQNIPIAKSTSNKNGFSIDSLFNACEKKISNFVSEHANETFSAFAIDGGTLALNTIDRQNVGNEISKWKYPGFAEFSEDEGFDEDLYDEHYNLDEEKQKTSAYKIAMEKVLKKVQTGNAIASLKKSEPFFVLLGEHTF